MSVELHFPIGSTGQPIEQLLKGHNYIMVNQYSSASNFDCDLCFPADNQQAGNFIESVVDSLKLPEGNDWSHMDQFFLIEPYPLMNTKDQIFRLSFWSYNGT